MVATQLAEYLREICRLFWHRTNRFIVIGDADDKPAAMGISKRGDNLGDLRADVFVPGALEFKRKTFFEVLQLREVGIGHFVKTFGLALFVAKRTVHGNPLISHETIIACWRLFLFLCMDVLALGWGLFFCSSFCGVFFLDLLGECIHLRFAFAFDPE